MDKNTWGFYAPDEGIVVGEVVGYRLWKLQNGLLRSWYMTEHVWVPGGYMEANFGPVTVDGVHALKSQELARDHAQHYSCVFGSVSLYGEVIEHEYGYRAQFAKIKSIDAVFMTGPIRRYWALRKLRKTYGV